MKPLLRKSVEPAKLADSTSEKISVLRDQIAALRARQSEASRQQEALFDVLRMARSTSPVHTLAALLMEDPAAQPIEAPGVQSQLHDVQLLLESITRAITAKEAEIVAVSAEADAAACREVLPTHRSNVRATINAVLALHRAITAQDELRMDLNRKGVERTSQLIPLYPSQFRDGMGDPNSWLSSFMRNAVADGFISEPERIAIMTGDAGALDT